MGFIVIHCTLAWGPIPTSKQFLSELTYLDCPQDNYDKVRCNMNNIITTLKSIPGATDMLIGMYKQKGWTNITVHPAEDQQVTLALQRIKQDPKQYDLFIDMLRDIRLLTCYLEWTSL